MLVGVRCTGRPELTTAASASTASGGWTTTAPGSTTAWGSATRSTSYSSSCQYRHSVSENCLLMSHCRYVGLLSAYAISLVIWTWWWTDCDGCSKVRSTQSLNYLLGIVASM